MTGTIGPTTPGRVLELILEHPEVEEILLRDVPGSMDDHANLRAAAMVRQSGLGTHVPADGEVASGGTDFFLAGRSRSIEEGARFGVHSWAGFNEEGADLPRSHPEHEKYLEYYRQMEIPEGFYWFTLEAAPASGIHWMDASELQRYRFTTDEAPDRNEGPSAEEKSKHLGGCILRQPLGEIPTNLLGDSRIHAAEGNGSFSKQIKSCGIILLAEKGVPNTFLGLIDRATREIFGAGPGIDAGLQAEVLGKMHAYRALLPVPHSEESFERWIGLHEEAFDRIQLEHSACDIIMAEVPGGQVMEVVEHLLHAISDVGLHYQFPREWGVSRKSELWQAMQRAIEAGYYDVSSYDDLRGEAPEIVDRVLLQEFAYWFISTAWDLQEPYGPREEEWTISNRAELEEKCPEFFAVYERTAARVLCAPKRSTLAEIGPTREEESGR